MSLSTEIPDVVYGARRRPGSKKQVTITAAYDVLKTDGQCLIIDGGASARDVNLWPTTPDHNGHYYDVVNAGTANLVVKAPDGTTLLTVGPGRKGLLQVEDAAWVSFGSMDVGYTA